MKPALAAQIRVTLARDITFLKRRLAEPCSARVREDLLIALQVTRKSLAMAEGR